MDKKRLIIAAGFVLFVIIMGIVLYQVFFKDTTITTPPTTTPPGTSVTDPGAFPVSGQGQPSTGQTPGTSGQLPGSTVTQPPGQGNEPPPRVRPVTTDIVLDAQTNARGNVQYYNQLDGKFYRIGANGQPELLSDQVFFEVQSVTWSPNQSEAILEYPDGANIFYDFDTEQQATLPRHWEEFSFSDDGDKIAAKSLGFSEENRWLVTSNPDGSQTRLVEPMGANADKVIVDWSPNKQVVALSRTGEAQGAFREEVLLIGQNGENFKSLIVEGRGLETEWSPSGDNLLHSVFSNTTDYKPELWVTSASGNDVGSRRRRLNVNTWASKCAFQNDQFIYCGVPTSLERGAGYAPETAALTPDRLVRINVDTGQRTNISLDERLPTIDTIFFSENGQTLYFTDATRDGIFEVDI